MNALVDKTYDEKLDLINAMERFGGSFAKALAKTWIVADPKNRAYIEMAWTEMIMGYETYVEKEAM